MAGRDDIADLGAPFAAFDKINRKFSKTRDRFEREIERGQEIQRKERSKEDGGRGDVGLVVGSERQANNRGCAREGGRKEERERTAER